MALVWEEALAALRVVALEVPVVDLAALEEIKFYLNCINKNQ